MGGCDVVATEYGRYSFVLYAATVSSAGLVCCIWYVGSFKKFYCC